MLRPNRKFGAALGSSGSVALALLVPKCPMCIAALFAGAVTFEQAALFRPLAFAIAAATTIALIVWARRRPRPCCRPASD